MQCHLEVCSPQRLLVVSELGRLRGGLAASTCRRHTCRQAETLAQHMHDRSCSGDMPGVPGRGLQLVPAAGLLVACCLQRSLQCRCSAATPRTMVSLAVAMRPVGLMLHLSTVGSGWPSVACGPALDCAKPCQPSHTAPARQPGASPGRPCSTVAEEAGAA